MKTHFCVVVFVTLRNSVMIIVHGRNGIFELWAMTVSDCSCILVLLASLHARHIPFRVQLNKDKTHVTIRCPKQLPYHTALGQVFGKDGKPMASYLEKFLPPSTFVNDRILTAFPYSDPPPPNLPGKTNINQDEEGDDDADSDQHSRYPEYASLNRRQQSFTRWPHQSPTAQDMSESGFFYTGHDDLVRCYKCGIGFKDFSSDDDDPLHLHASHSPDCPFLCQMFGEDTVTKRLCSTKYLPLYKHQRKPRNENIRIRHPDYQNHRDRLNSFNEFPNGAVRPEDLADAGLFYTGQGDLVRCFTCDGGLRSWEYGDDAWNEHCRWFPNCSYVRQHRNEDFISQAASGGMTDEFDDNRDDIFNEFYQHLPTRGVGHYLLLDELCKIDVLNEEKHSLTQLIENETPLDLNLRLKSIVICQKCNKNEINILFQPCGHHKLCMSCAESLEKCPVCERQIREKIRTYMG